MSRRRVPGPSRATNLHLVVLATQVAALHDQVAARRWTTARNGATRFLREIERGGPTLAARVQPDTDWVAALLVRAEWQLGPDRSRGSRIEQAFYVALQQAPTLTLRQVLDIHRDEPPRFRRTLRTWAALLLDPRGWWSRYHPAHRRLVSEVVDAGLSIDDLELLAQTYPATAALLALTDKLEQDGELAKAIRVAERAVSNLYLPEDRRRLQVRLGAIYMASGQAERAHREWQQAWRQDVSTDVLCQIWDAAGTAAPGFFGRVLEQAYSEDAVVSPDLQTRIEILLGDIDVPLARLQAASLQGWWEAWLDGHPARLVLPLLLRLGTGKTELSQDLLVKWIWQSTDQRTGRTRGSTATAGPGWSDLVDQVIRTHPSWLVDAPSWRASATSVLAELVEAVITARAPNAYGKLANLLATLIEVSAIAGDPKPKAAVQAILRHYPRYRAIPKRVDELWSASPLFPEGD